MDSGEGKEVLRMVESHNPDLILLDVLLPDINGLEILRRLKRNKSKKIRKIPVIMLTGVKNREVNLQAKKLKAADYILKPFNTKVLLLKLKRHLNIS